MKFKLTLYQETYTDLVVEAPSAEAAKEIATLGKFEPEDVKEVSVSESCVIGDAYQVKD